jgi:hypothetical protein
MKNIIKLAGVLLCFFISGAVFADNALVDVAGKQRMLSQKVAKAYIFKGLGIRKDVASKQVSDGINELQKNSKVLKSQVGDETIKGLLGAVSIDIDNFSTLVQEPYSKENGKKILQLSDTILSVSHEITTKLVDLLGTQTSRTVNVSGRQRMLSQRATKLYIAINAGIAGSDATKMLNDVVSDFNKAHQLLKNEPKNNRRIKKELGRVERLWGLVSGYFAKGAKSDMYVTVYTLTDSITEKMDKINKMYVEIL